MSLSDSRLSEIQSGTNTTRIDDTGTYTYIGLAPPGSSESETVWLIKRITNADNTVLFANGNAEYDSAWSNRASETYT